MNDGDEYFYDKLEWVRVRVEEEHWTDLSPSAPSERGAETTAERKSPYSIVVRFARYVVKVMLRLAGFYDAVWPRTRGVVVIPTYYPICSGEQQAAAILVFFTMLI